MIVFDLKCTCGCQFEGWFESRSDFDRQNDVGQLTCPRCESSEIHKILSPVAYHSGPSMGEECVSATAEQQEITPEAAVQFLRAIQDVVEKNFEDVGPELAAESLRMHYGVKPPRNIRGVTTEAEEKMLADEGIELLKVPMVKKSSGPKLN